jgi:predicted dinucleotide-binding enzyme
MRVGVLGTGNVGRAIADKLLALGHEVTMGSRSAGGDALAAWLRGAEEGAAGGTFAEAAASSELLFNCTAGTASLAALQAAGAANLEGKVLIDVANALEVSGDGPPTLSVCNVDSLAEQIQTGFPEARVVKALNTVNHRLMTEPARAPGDHNVFICGNDESAKDQAAALLEEFGWPPTSIIDLGEISSARGTEMYMALWLRLWGRFQTADLNIEVRVA